MGKVPAFARVALVPPAAPSGIVLVVRGRGGLKAEHNGLDVVTAVAVMPVPGGGFMVGLASGRPIFLATGVTDLLRGVMGLYVLILEQLAQERKFSSL